MGRRIVTFSLAWTLAAAIAPALQAPAQPPPSPSGSAYNPYAYQTAPGPSNAIRSVDLNSNPAQPVQPAIAPSPAFATSGIQQVQNVNPAPPPSVGSTNVPPIDPVPSAPGGPLEPPLFETPTIPLPNISLRKLKIRNRSSNPTNAKYMTLPNGEQIALVTGGIKMLVSFEDKFKSTIDIEADSLVVWQKGGQTSELVDAMQNNDGVSQSGEKEIELYLAGNVIMRYGNLLPKPGVKLTDQKTMRAERVYLDVTHNRAVAKKADLEFIRSDLPFPAHYKSDEWLEVSQNEFVTKRSYGSASKLPADAELDLRLNDLKITEEKDVVTRTIFGFPVIDRETGQQDVGVSRNFTARNTFLEVMDVPIMWFPYLAGDVNDPAGPLQGLSIQEDRIFGAQIYTTWSILELLGVKKLPNEKLNLELDYLSTRGPGIGLNYDLSAPKLFGYDAPFITHFLAYGIYDHGQDQLDGTRDYNWNLPEPGLEGPTNWRGRAFWRHIQDYDDFSFQGQVAYLSDPNFLESYYKYEFDQGPNQETFGYLKWQHGDMAATLLAEPNLDRPWETESQWLPKVEGWWMGQSIFDRLTYNTWASVGYSNLQVYNLPPNQMPPGFNPATIPTEQGLSAGRVDWMQQISLPLSLGFLKLVPYANVDVAYYTDDNEGDDRGRVYVGGGARASTSLSRQYNDVDSEFLNLQGLNHKMTLTANYYNAYSNTPSSMLPQLDRLNDDATLQANRDMQPWFQTYYPGQVGNALLNSPLYNPVLYANRRLIDTNPDTLDSMQVLQLDFDQRWQTKRGYPGMEHTVDYITLDLSASYFPEYNRDDFGHPWAFLEYNASWAMGDRNGITSYGWVDPFAFGTKLVNVNAYFNRPDNTSYNIGFTSYEPLNSRLVYGSVAYTFSPKYSVSFNASYDLTIQNNESVGFSLNRIGTDLTWTVGFSYNALTNNFGFQFMVIPNLLAGRMGLPGVGSSMLGQH